MWRIFSKEYWQKVVGPYLGPDPQQRAIKFTAVLRITYFFAVSSMALYIYNEQKRYQAQQQLELGRPTLLENDPKYRIMKERATKAGLIYKYNDQGVLKDVEFDKEKYYQTLEQETLEKVKEAQRKALEEGRELPPDAIKLV